MSDGPVPRSERIFEALVRAIYPRGFSDRYGREMSQTFGQLCRDARLRGGTTGIARLWMSELPALAVGALSERSTTMARAIRAAGRIGVQKTVMTADAVVLVALGGALVLWAPQMLVAYDMLDWSQVPATASAWEGDPVLALKMTAQALGATMVGLGIVVSSFLVRTGPGTTPHGRLASAHAVISFGFMLILLQYPSPLGWLTLVAFLILAASYALLWTTGAARRSSTGQPGASPSSGVKGDPIRPRLTVSSTSRRTPSATTRRTACRNAP